MSAVEELKQFKTRAKQKSRPEMVTAFASDEFKKLVEAARTETKVIAAANCTGHCVGHCGSHCVGHNQGTHCGSHCGSHCGHHGGQRQQ